MPICRFNSCIERSDSLFCQQHTMSKHSAAVAPVVEQASPVMTVEQASGSKQSKGGKARARNLSPERRSEIAKKAAASRWNKPQET